MNVWITSFIVSWILFFILIEYKRLVPNIFVGIIALFMQILVDSAAGNLKLYYIEYPIIKLCHSSLFFTFGPALTMGTLLAQYYPRERKMKVINILVWTVLFFLFEFSTIHFKYLVYTNWQLFYSILVDIIVLSTLSYVCELLVHYKGEKGPVRL